MLKDSGRWSFRQPKKQRGLGGPIKTHWDYLVDEMVNKEEGESRSHELTITGRNGCESISERKGNGKLPSHTPSCWLSRSGMRLVPLRNAFGEVYALSGPRTLRRIYLLLLTLRTMALCPSTTLLTIARVQIRCM